MTAEKKWRKKMHDNHKHILCFNNVKVDQNYLPKDFALREIYSSLFLFKK